MGDDKFFGLHAVHVGSTIIVLYDPNDHEEILADIDATKTAQRRNVRTVGIDAATLAGITSAQPSQAPVVADELGKHADLRDRGVLTAEEFAAQKAKLLGA